MRIIRFDSCRGARVIELASFAVVWLWVLCRLSLGQEVMDQDAKKPLKYAIALHGGAGTAPSMYPRKANEQRRASLEKALRLGVDVLADGGTALDAVERVVRFLEDDPQFNAGVGAVFNAAGGHELDAAIMDGKTLNCGAVAGVSRIKNPITLARRVMTDSPHVLLIGPGAEEFAQLHGFELVPPETFDTPQARKAWERTKRRQGEHPASNWKPKACAEDIGTTMGTVGCVALDSHGNLAAATSTGGMSNKSFGRVGDSPIIGAGTYAANGVVAVSCTGTGEQFMRHVVAYEVAALMKYRQLSVDDSVNQILTHVLEPDDGGIIAVAQNGEISVRYNTLGMGSGAADSTGRFEIFWDLSQSKPDE